GRGFALNVRGVPENGDPSVWNDIRIRGIRHEEGKMAVAMRLTLNDSTREFSANERGSDITELLRTFPPLALDGLFDDPNVRRRIGEVISNAMNRPRRLPRRSRRRSSPLSRTNQVT